MINIAAVSQSFGGLIRISSLHFYEFIMYFHRAVELNRCPPRQNTCTFVVHLSKWYLVVLLGWSWKVHQLVASRCLPGRQDASPYGWFSGPAAQANDFHMLSLWLHKVKASLLSQSWSTSWKKLCAVFIWCIMGILLQDVTVVYQCITRKQIRARKQESPAWLISSLFLKQQKKLQIVLQLPCMLIIVLKR